MSQSELEARSCNWCQARESARKVGFVFAPDWSEKKNSTITLIGLESCTTFSNQLKSFANAKSKQGHITFSMLFWLSIESNRVSV